jgi:actin-related protein 7
MEGNMCVIDRGTHTFKAGYAYNFPSEEEPRVQIPLESFRESTPSQSREKGDIKELEALLRHSLYDRLGWIEGYEGCVVVAEPMLTSRSDREDLTQLMFEV